MISPPAQASLRVRPHRARARQRRDVHGDPRGREETAADWVINGEKMWNTGMHAASHDLDLRPHQREAGQRATASPRFLVPVGAPGFKVEEYLWTFNMPTDHAHVSLTDVRVPDAAIFGGEGRGLRSCSTSSTRTASARPPRPWARRSTASTRVVKYAKAAQAVRQAAGDNQAIQFPLVELQTQCEMLRVLIHKTAWQMDAYGPLSRSLRQGLDVQLLGQPAGLRGRRPGDAGARRPRLLAAQAVRAHLPPPPPLPDHRGLRGDPDAPGGAATCSASCGSRRPKGVPETPAGRSGA